MATRDPEQVQVTVCDRCEAVLSKIVKGTESKRGREEIVRKKHGPVYLIYGDKRLFHYEEVCVRCLEVIKRMARRCEPTKRGGYRPRKQNVEKKRKVR